MPARDPNPAPGQEWDGYHLIRFLGRGGFGEVWLCRSGATGTYHALKFVSGKDSDIIEKEHHSLGLYRSAAARLRSPHLVPIEHINRHTAGLYYVMPLADGTSASDPTEPSWQPLSLAAYLGARAEAPMWFSSREIIGLIHPILDALQSLSDAGLVHRDVKPDNILFFNGSPCLGDISLLGEDAAVITRRGTPGYATPSWYRGGHPDMYGASATLYTLLTGNSPDMMGKSAFLWPPQGEHSLPESERAEWKRLHAVIRRATDEKVAERYVDFRSMAGLLASPPLGGSPLTQQKLPRLIATLLTLAGISAATFVAAYRSKTPDKTAVAPNAETVDAAQSDLTPDQRADYQALAGMIQGYISDGHYGNALASVEELLAAYPQARTQPAYSVARAMALKGLGRDDEAKEELRKEVNVSPNLPALNLRKELWEEFGDLAEAENDLTRVLEKYGPSTFILYLRADIRAKRGNFIGVHQDRESANAIKSGGDQQQTLVNSMWDPLESNHPGYKSYLESLGTPEATIHRGHNIPEADAQVLEVFDKIMSGFVEPGIPLTEGARRGRESLAVGMRDAFGRADYSGCLLLLERAIMSVPVMADTPDISLFRALLFQRLDRLKDAEMELDKSCHHQTETSHTATRTILLDAMGRQQTADPDSNATPKVAAPTNQPPEK